jgi:hypothetical protein
MRMAGNADDERRRPTRRSLSVPFRSLPWTILFDGGLDFATAFDKCQYVGTEGHEGNEEYGSCYHSCCVNTWRLRRRPPPEARSVLTLRFLC